MDYTLVTGEEYAITGASDGSPVITVTNAAEYAAAMASLKTTGGTVLVDSSGGAFRLDTHRVNAENRIVVTSADPDAPAESLGMKVSNSSNITFTGLDFPPVESRDGPHQAAYFQSSSNMEFVGNTIRGIADGKLGIDTMDAAYGGGVHLRACADMTVADNVIDSVKSGITTSNGTNTLIQGNIITGMQADVMRVVSSVDTTIDRNVVDGLHGSSGDLNHPDIVQYYDNRADAPVVGLTITNNYFNSGDTSYQGIYGGMNHGSGPYRDILIENNLIVTGSKTGINANFFDGVTIRNNTVLYNADALSHKTMDTEFGNAQTPLISVNYSANVEVTGNLGNVDVRDPATHTLTGSVLFENNFQIDYDNALADNHIDNIMVNVGVGGEKDLRDFQVIDGSGADGFGSSLARIPDLDMLGMSTVRADNLPQSLVMSVHGAQEGVVYTWTTADGRVFEGAQTTIGFAEPGTHEVTLTAEAADGSTESITRRVMADDSRLFDFDPNSGFPVPFRGKDVHELSGDAQIEAAEDGSGRMVLDLDPDDSFGIVRGQDGFNALNRFSLLLDFRQQPPEDGTHVQTSGVIMSKQAGFSFKVEADGALRVWIRDANGVDHGAVTEPGLLMDTDWHSLSVSYDGTAGGLSVRFDDIEVARVEMSGTLDLSDRPILIGAVRNTPGIDAEIGALRVIDVATETDSQIREPISMIPEDAMTGIVIDPIVAPPPVEETTDSDGATHDDDPDLAAAPCYQVTFDAADAENGRIGGLALVDGRNGAAIAFDGTERQSFSLGDLSDMKGGDAFTVATALRVDDPGDAGRILFLRGLFEMSINNKGALDLRTNLVGDDGERVVDRSILSAEVTARLTDGDFHHVVTSYSGERDTLSVWIDGDLVHESALSGRIGGVGQTMIGNTWGATFDGAVEEVTILAAAVDTDAVLVDHAAYAGLAMPAGGGGLPAPAHLSLIESMLDGALVLAEDFEGALDPDADADDFTFVETANDTIALDFNGGEKNAFHLDGVEDLVGSDDFTIATSLRVDDMAESGSILRLRGLFDLSVNGKGQLDWSTMLPDEDGQRIKVRNALGGEVAELLSDGDMHRVVASYGAEAAEVSLWIDGMLVDSAPLKGGTTSFSQTFLGNAWGDVFDGAVDDIAIFRQAADAAMIESDYIAFSTTSLA